MLTLLLLRVVAEGPGGVGRGGGETGSRGSGGLPALEVEPERLDGLFRFPEVGAKGAFRVLPE